MQDGEGGGGAGGWHPPVQTHREKTRSREKIGQGREGGPRRPGLDGRWEKAGSLCLRGGPGLISAFASGQGQRAAESPGHAHRRGGVVMLDPRGGGGSSGHPRSPVQGSRERPPGPPGLSHFRYDS